MTKKSDLKLFSATGQPIRSLEGTWKNELDSTMVIDAQDDNGLLTGTYTSKVSDDGQEVTGVLTGYISSDTVSWTVNWAPTFKSVTAWAGKVLADPAGDPILYTLWNLSHGVAKPQDWWQSFQNGSDRFWRLGA